ncbi:MAG: hypothetical protein LBL58_03060 [Tannerellaceae bacterium]|jgi:ABC-type Fe3+-hydroxamate transport system substrate-binding protein|nr:hypothetical protein [Tannerellaceae bacterium]
MSKTISDQVAKVEMLISGLKKYSEIAENANLDTQVITELELEAQALAKQNQELERLMEEARPISKEANRKLTDVREKYQAIKKKVKLSADSSQWGQVGIMDKR